MHTAPRGLVSSVAFAALLIAGAFSPWLSPSPAGASEDRAPSPPPAAEKPNILFILIDDLGWSDLGCYGHPYQETPHIDRLAAEGLRFTDFYAASPVCSSTRASIESGQYPARTGITDFIPGHWRPFEELIVAELDHRLPDSVETPGHVLSEAGYVTGYFGKWHLGGGGPGKHGYEVHAGTAPPRLRQGRNAGGVARNPGPKRMDLLTEQALWFLEEHRESPFFLHLSHHAVHIPIEAPPDLVEKYRKKVPGRRITPSSSARESGGREKDGARTKEHSEGQGGDSRREDARHRRRLDILNPGYAAMLEYLDHQLGRVLEKLEELELEEKTIVIFTSDNGGLRRIYTGAGEWVTTNAPLRAEKGTIYEGGIRVPMIVRAPGLTEAGTLTSEPATTSDLLPTFVELAGASPPPQVVDGLSLVPLLEKPAARLEREAIYFHYPHYHHDRPAGAARSGPWKLILDYADRSTELYDLSRDIAESRDLSSDRAALTAKLRSDLESWLASVGARMPVENPDHDPRRAGEWWSRRTKKPLDIEAMRRRYRSSVKERRN